MEKATTEMTEPGIDGDDRLSSLPDEVITHILSSLQTKYAVGTAVLSRRWKDLWTRVSNLDFDNSLIYQPLPWNVAFHSLPPDEQVKYLEGRFPTLEVLEMRLFDFSRFVYKVLSQHKNLDSVRRFRFHCSVGYRERKVSPYFWFEREWVFGPLVEEIDIVLDGETELGLPNCVRCLPESFYTLKNLKVAKLQGVILRSVKGSVLLPSVKILQLCQVEIKDLESLSSLISGCPVLETALLEGCCLSYRNEKDILMVSLPTLKKLKMIRFGNSGMCPIVIEAPNLEELDLQWFPELKFMGSSPLSCLRSAHVDIGVHQCSNHSLNGVLCQISNARKMFLSGQTLRYLSVVDDVQLPDFPNLMHLTIQTGANTWVLHSLLNSAPKLQSLVIHMETPMLAMDWGMLEDLWTPECLLSSLEEIEVKDLVSNEDEMKLVSYLLKAGAVLETVDLHLQDHHVDIKDRSKLASLLKLPRKSRCCEARLLLPNNQEIRIDSDSDETDFDDDMDDDDDDFHDIDNDMGDNDIDNTDNGMDSD